MRPSFALACSLVLIQASATHAADETVRASGKIPVQRSWVDNLFGNDAGTDLRDSESTGWSFSLGGGVSLDPKYEGARKVKASPTPVANVQWQSLDSWGTTLFAGTDRGVGISFGSEEEFVLGATVGYGGGRKEKDGPRLRGLGDIDDSVLAGVFLEVPVGPFGFGIETKSDLGGDTGTTVNFGFGAGLPITERLSIGATVTATWADDAHMEAYFSVSSRQAARSQAGLKPFSAKSGFKSVAFGLDATYAFNPAWQLNVSGGFSNLLGDASQSPISERDLQPTLSISLVRLF